jgi:hypothetical protein
MLPLNAKLVSELVSLLASGSQPADASAAALHQVSFLSMP